MAQRTNTVEYAFATRTTALSAASRHDFSAITLTVAETSRTFRSVYVEISTRGTETTGTSMSSWLIGIKLGATAFSDTTVTSTLTNTGDQQSHVFRSGNIASYFESNYGASADQTCQVGAQFGALGVINVSAKIVITYEFDDSSATTRTKTVRIPIESGTTTLTNTLAEIGTNQVPQLTGAGSPFLPEASITVKDLFFEIVCNEGHASGTTDDQLGVELDSEGETLFGALEEALDSSPWMRVIWKRTDMDTTAAHAFKARGTTTGRLPQLGALLVVTYTYDHSSSSTLLNSLLLPVPTELGSIGGTASGNQSRTALEFFVEEPTTITLKQSAVLITYNAPNVAITGLTVGAGAQTPRAYTPLTAVNSPAGQHSLIHRFDSGGAAGSGITLARGLNTLTINVYRTSSAAGSVGAGLSALAILNYTSGKASAGSGVHNHTTLWVVGGTAAVGTTTVYDYSAFAPDVPETSFWTTCAGFLPEVMHAGKNLITFAGEHLSGEDVEDGWHEFRGYPMNGSNELSVFTPFIHAHMFRRHPSDPDPERMGVEDSRVYRVSTYIDPAAAHAGWTSLVMALTYHAITYAIAGSSTSYSGDGSGITVTAHDVDTGEKVATGTTSAGGGYSITWYDNTRSMFTESRQDGTHVARSDNGTAS